MFQTANALDRLAIFYTACHNNVPKKGWRHKCCRKKTSRSRYVFLTTTIKRLLFIEDFKSEPVDISEIQNGVPVPMLLNRETNWKKRKKIIP
jgi:hypothetical protein